MTYGIADFLGLLFIGWLIVFLLHQTIGGFIMLFNRVIYKHHAIVITGVHSKQK